MKGLEGDGVEYKTIGQNMKKQRKAMGLKQEEFAELAGLSTSYYPE